MYWYDLKTIEISSKEYIVAETLTRWCLQEGLYPHQVNMTKASYLIYMALEVQDELFKGIKNEEKV